MIGEIGMILSAIACAIYYRLYQELDNYNTSTTLFWSSLITIIFVSIFYGGWDVNITSLSIHNWTYIILLALICTFGAFGFLILSSKTAGALATGTLDFVEPIVGVVLAMIVFGESLSLIQLVGWFLILFTIFNIKRIR